MRNRNRKYRYNVAHGNQVVRNVVASTRLSAAHKAARVLHVPCVIDRATMFVNDCSVECVGEVSRAEYRELSGSWN